MLGYPYLCLLKLKLCGCYVGESRFIYCLSIVASTLCLFQSIYVVKILYFNIFSVVVWHPRVAWCLGCYTLEAVIASKVLEGARRCLPRRGTRCGCIHLTASLGQCLPWRSPGTTWQRVHCNRRHFSHHPRWFPLQPFTLSTWDWRWQH
jgi:hypothetical protein